MQRDGVVPVPFSRLACEPCRAPAPRKRVGYTLRGARTRRIPGTPPRVAPMPKRTRNVPEPAIDPGGRTCPNLPSFGPRDTETCPDLPKCARTCHVFVRNSPARNEANFVVVRGA